MSSFLQDSFNKTTQMNSTQANQTSALSYNDSLHEEKYLLTIKLIALFGIIIVTFIFGFLPMMW
jgi:hypothetical protein